MQYLYKDFPFGRHTIRYVRLPNFPTRTTAYRYGGAFHKAGELPAASASLTTHDLYHLGQLREQQATEKRLVYFDIADAQLDNSEPDLAVFEAWVGTEDASEWELSSNRLA
jgi:hypothetical protein